ncbi:unnamed protein product [Moneuplotes crassus]|uniref:RING-type domain-containing protein n=1 Tax=Euplotes crassus TaxID=5936 RepID=A0AAD1XLF5_EUPCR|nr:unnamed protein product [Moneuplotes crassus]
MESLFNLKIFSSIKGICRRSDRQEQDIMTTQPDEGKHLFINFHDPDTQGQLCNTTLSFDDLKKRFKKRELKLCSKQLDFDTASPSETDLKEVEDLEVATFDQEKDKIVKKNNKEIKEGVDFSNLCCTKCDNLLFLSRTLTCGHSYCIFCTYKYILKDFKCLKCEEQVQTDDIDETLQIQYSSHSIDKMILMLNSRITNQDQVKKNLERIQECIDFKKKKLTFKSDPGCKIDILDLNSLKWCKGEILKKTNMSSSSRSLHMENHNGNALLYIQYKKDGNQTNAYIREDSVAIAPEGYFTKEDESFIQMRERAMDTSFVSSLESPDRFMRVITRLNRILNINNAES